MAVGAVSAYTDQMDLFGIVSGKKRPDDAKGAPKAKGASSENLTPDQQKEVEKLKQTDQKVRAHEQAHVAAGGAYIKGGISFQYQKGPDGKMYAVGGEVSIDTSPVKNNPQATIAKMEQVKAAALAPADPSGADRAVAASASQTEAQARQDQVQQTAEKVQGGKKPEADTQKKEFTPVFTYTASGQTIPLKKSKPAVFSTVV